MRVKVTAWDIPSGSESMDLGLFESVQLTDMQGGDMVAVLRDENGVMIAYLGEDGWWAQGVRWTDITFEARS